MWDKASPTQAVHLAGHLHIIVPPRAPGVHRTTAFGSKRTGVTGARQQLLAEGLGVPCPPPPL